MKLKKIFYLGEFRRHSYGELELLDRTVFEVTDLTIPAGTDWSSVPYSLGDFTWPENTALVYNFSLELRASPTGDDQIVIEVDDENTNAIGARYRTFSSAMGGRVAQSVGGVTGDSPTSVPFDADAESAGQVLYPHIWTPAGPPLVHALHVVRAHASFLVF